MKKTLVALAAMTAMCGASATSVTLYGVVDTGFAYSDHNPVFLDFRLTPPTER